MGFADRLKALFGLGGSRDSGFFDELSDLLVEGDLGGVLAMEVSAELRKRCQARTAYGEAAIRSELKAILRGYGKEANLDPDPEAMTVYLLLGVNGVGKTTSAARLARRFIPIVGAQRIVLAAGDTFRAAAIDQLRLHGERLGVKVVAQAQGSDSAAVIHDAISAAIASEARVVIADTAGRMHTRSDLVRELGKIAKVVAARTPGAVLRHLLIIDATTGQNGLRQAETFSAAVPVDGLILTKYDSSARGGLVLAIARSLGIPTAYVGTGEGHGDFVPFALDSFLDEFVGPTQ
ncbi:MAG: signal recognition particle-docking protein FtsY [Spirochaetota bacterium]